jgi:raffinose/stachyose/melibiose transport system substrate-binding protein
MSSIPSHRRRCRALRAPRRLMIGMTVAAVAIVASACGSGTQDDDGASGGGGGEKVTLRFTHVTGNPALEALLKEYEKVAPNVKIEASFAPVDDLQTSLRAQLGGGNAPDLFVVWPGNGSAMAVQQLAPTGVLADISDQEWISDVPENLRPLLGDGGKSYIWAPGVTPIGAIYNKQVFKQAGVEPPKTWSEVLEACDKIKAAGKVPIALGNQTPWITQLIPYAIAPSTAFAENPNLAQDMLDGKTSFSESGWRDVFERYLELNERGCFNESPNGTTFEQQQAMVARGDAGMAVQVANTATAIRDQAKKPGDIGMFPFPGSDSPDDLKIAAGVAAGVGANAKGKHLDEAKKFLEWLGKPENMAKYSLPNQSIPLIGADDVEFNDLVAPFAPFLAEGKTVPFMDQQWPNAKVQPAHFAGVQELFAGDTDVDGLLKKLDEAYQQG